MTHDFDWTGFCKRCGAGPRGQVDGPCRNDVIGISAQRVRQILAEQIVVDVVFPINEDDGPEVA